MISFVAPAEEVKSWAGVPHKTTDFLGGFQRPLSDRFQQIVEFFEEEGNSSPTSIVVAFRPGAAKVVPLPVPEDWKKSLPVSSVPEPVIVEVIDQNFDSLGLDELAAQVHSQISGRVAVDAQGAEEEEVADPSAAVPPADQSDEPLPGEEESGDEWGVDVGQSALSSFASKIGTPNALHAYRQTLSGEILSVGDAATTEEADKKAGDRLRELFVSLLQPAMIVDGQHRVWGASECANEIPFSVVGLLDADWDEQVFQFVVINKQARAISGEFLASIVNSSLTNREIGELETRLEAAGLKTYETRMLRLMNDDPDSPFSSMVSRGLEEVGKKITFKTGIAIVRRWHTRMNDRDKAYKALFRNGLPGDTAKEKRAAWETSWKSYMFAFWNGVKNLYKDEQLWDPGTQLMYRACLEVMQENFLNKKAEAGGVTYKDPVALREDVEEFYGNVPAGFFHTEWKRKELLTDDGKQVLEDALNAMRVPGTKLKNLAKTEPLFTGANTKSSKKKAV